MSQSAPLRTAPPLSVTVPELGAVPLVGGAAMYPNRTIMDNVDMSGDHTTLVAAIEAIAGLVDTLGSAGPYTLFAPTNSAFDELPAGTMEKLFHPPQERDLATVLTYHIVPGRLTSGWIQALAHKHNGIATLTTLQGEKLRVKKAQGAFWLVDAMGRKARITMADAMQSNGVIHVVDAVLMP